MRLRQWVKNLLLFVPLGLAHRYIEPGPLLSTAIAFVSFGLGASAVYVLNDLLDVEADRHHPVKRRRPFASGDLPLAAGFVLGPALVVLSLGLALLLPRSFVGVLLLYFVLTTFYSLRLKELALIDVMVLASLYTLRMIAGSAASGVEVSEWLLAFSMFVFLSLGAVKRYGELYRLRVSANETAQLRRRGYLAGDLELIVPMGLSSGYIAVLVLALYISSSTVTAMYARPVMLWFVCPLMLYWISRIWLLAHRGLIDDDPLSFAVRDRITWIIAAIGAVVVLVARGA
jgi:4-hydroxybenzoate polyprenyltransferase